MEKKLSDETNGLICFISEFLEHHLVLRPLRSKVLKLKNIGENVRGRGN